MFEVKPSDRLAALPPYLFAEIDRRRDKLRRAGKEIIDLGVGDPDLPTPAPIIAALAEAAADPRHHRYPTNEGSPAFRVAVAEHYHRRHGVELDPDTEVVCLIGTKEGIGHLPLAVVDPGAEVVIPDPGYPVYLSGTLFAGGVPRPMRLRPELGWLPDLAELEDRGLEQASLLFVNYPNNPTGAVADHDFYRRLVDLAARHRLLVAADAAYADLTVDPAGAPSILEVPGAKEVAIELGSFSKTFNMTGWRLGYAVGNAAALRALVAVKSNIDSGCFGAVQMAGVRALELYDEHLPALRRIYDERRRIAVAGLGELGVEVFPPAGTFYVWARVPGEMRSVELAAQLLRTTGVVVTPGVGFGHGGEGYFRLALCVDGEQVRLAMSLLKGARLWASSAC